MRLRSRRVETLRHQAPSKFEESSASRRQPRSNARQDSLTRETQNTVLSSMLVVACCIGFYIRHTILLKTRRFVFVPLSMIGHVLTCVWLISHFVAFFSPCFICLSLLSQQHGINEHERSSRPGMLSGRCTDGFTGFLRSVFSRLWFLHIKSVANVFLFQLRTWY